MVPHFEKGHSPFCNAMTDRTLSEIMAEMHQLRFTTACRRLCSPNCRQQQEYLA